MRALRIATIVCCLLYTIIAHAAPAESPANAGQGSRGASDSRLVGSWLMRTPQVEIKAEFSSDGRFTRTFRRAQQSKTEAGSWELQDNLLELHFDGDQSTSRLIVRMPDADTLEMMEDGENGMRLVRRAQGAP